MKCWAMLYIAVYNTLPLLPQLHPIALTRSSHNSQEALRFIKSVLKRVVLNQTLSILLSCMLKDQCSCRVEKSSSLVG